MSLLLRQVAHSGAQHTRILPQDAVIRFTPGDDIVYVDGEQPFNLDINQGAVYLMNDQGKTIDTYRKPSNGYPRQDSDDLEPSTGVVSIEPAPNGWFRATDVSVFYINGHTYLTYTDLNDNLKTVTVNHDSNIEICGRYGRGGRSTDIYRIPRMKYNNVRQMSDELALSDYFDISITGIIPLKYITIEYGMYTILPDGYNEISQHDALLMPSRNLAPVSGVFINVGDIRYIYHNGKYYRKQL